MKTIKTLVLLFVLLFPFSAFVTMANGQMLEGVVVDAKTNEPLPFSNVGVLNKDNGTVTNEDGRFNIDISKLSSNDTIRISYIGYEASDIWGSSLDSKNRIKIRLNPIDIQIPEVQISNRKTRTFVSGNTVKWDKLSFSFMSRQLGAELGTLIRVNHRVILEQIRFHVIKTSLDSIVLRVNVYDLVNGMPCHNLLNKPLVIRARNEVGDVVVDVSDYNIALDDDFVVCLEHFKELGNDKSGILISAGVFNNPSFSRLGSQGKWYKVRFNKIIVGIGLNVKMREIKK